MTFRDDLRAVQRRLGVEDDGLIGPGTVAAMRLALDERDALRGPPANAGAAPSATSGPPEPVSVPGGVVAAPTGQSEAMSPSPKALALIREFEGYHRDLGDGRVEAYPDPASGGAPFTIGYGTTGPDVKRGTVWTREKAEERFAEHVREFAAGVAKAIGDAATEQHELDAMISLAYNIGLGNFRQSTLLRKHKSGDKAGAAGEFLRWNKAAGKIMAGLSRRRAAESAMYRGKRNG